MGKKDRKSQDFLCLYLGQREIKGSDSVCRCALVPFCSSLSTWLLCATTTWVPFLKGPAS